VTLLQDYYDHCQSRTGQGTVVKKYLCTVYAITCYLNYSFGLLKEVLDGIITYFDFTLLDHLLYAPERKQYEVVVKKKVHLVTSDQQQSTEEMPVECCSENAELPSRIYGAEHLLRLFGTYI